MEHSAKPPLYSQEGTIERQILDNAEAYFADRDEKLRFGLVKRVMQWMLDTDENGWFEKTSRARQDRNLRSLRGMNKQPSVRLSDREIDEYLRAVVMDTVNGHLGDEVYALHDYVESIQDIIPEQYQHRLQDILYGLNLDAIDRYKARMEELRRQGIRRSPFSS